MYFFFLHISSLKLEIHVGSAVSFLSFAIDGPGLQYELIQPQTCTWEPPRGLNPGNLQGRGLTPMEETHATAKHTKAQTVAYNLCD